MCVCETEREKERELVGVFSPVNHRGLHQGLRERETDRQTDRQRQAEIETERQRDWGWVDEKEVRSKMPQLKMCENNTRLGNRQQSKRS